jgi:cell division protein ZapA
LALQVSNVYIYGDKYTLKTDLDQSFIDEVAMYVDNKMKEMEKSVNTLTTSKIAIMAAFDIAAQYFLLCNEEKEVIKQIEFLEEKVEKVLQG